MGGLFNKGAIEHHVSEDRPMDTTILNHSGFQSLPKGVRRMLVASETFFFEQPQAHRKAPEERAFPTGMIEVKTRKNVDRLVTGPYSTLFPAIHFAVDKKFCTASMNWRG
jgi:hypothetical protein